jgi:hypothetical protein
MNLSNAVELMLGCLIVGVFIGILISSTTSNFAIEVTPNNSLRAAIAFK